MTPIQNKKIAIVGGGPGGLTLARLLQVKGATVIVYERDAHKDVRVQGATLDLHQDSGLKAIREAGLLKAFKANYRPGADNLRIVDQHARIAMDERGDTQDVAFDNEYFRPEIDRGPLRKILLESLEPNTVVWDSHFKSMSPEGNGWKLEFHNGSTTYADLVVAADGANSKLRPYLTSIKPFFAGITAIEGAVYDSAKVAPAMHQLLNGGKIFAFANEKSLIISSKGDGSMMFYTSCKTDEDWAIRCGIDFKNKEEVKTWFLHEFKGWDPIWLELFEKAAPNFIVRPQYCMPFDQQWEAQSNLTMLGDAAHLMPPYAGEGVNMAMQDALELSVCLTSEEFSDTRSAIAAFEKQMCERSSAMAQMTMEQTASLHSPQALSNMLAMFKIDE
jgi:2-polyprenyl-6-methoxyphenol hydroxylase-like FAD-dependent oxidoreductase